MEKHLTEFVLILLALIPVVSVFVFCKRDNKKDDKKSANNDFDYISFRESLLLTQLPIIPLYHNGAILKFVLDTGSSSSVINEQIVNNLSFTPTSESFDVIGIEGNVKKTNVIKIDLNYDDDISFSHTFRVLDMTKMNEVIKQETGMVIDGLLGSDVMAKNGYILDFIKKRMLYKK